jgi:tetratricopeptide (TPR) repeat protein
MLPSPAQLPPEASAVVGIRLLVAKQKVRCSLALLFFLAFLLSANLAAETFEELSAQASAAREQNDPARAIQLYTQALQLNPKSSEAWWFLGSLQYQTGDYAPATTALSHYLELQPDAAPALALRGLCEFETGDYQQALVDIQRGISRGAANDARHEQILHYHEGLLLTRLGRFDDALRSYQIFADKKISSPELLLAIGLAGLRMPMLPSDLNAEQQDLVGNTGVAGYQFMSGDTKGAQQAFENLFAKFPTQRNLHYFYGYILYAREPDSALAEFQNELRVAPDNLDALIMTSWVLLMENEPGEALPFAQRAVQQKADYVTAQLVLGRSLMETGNLDEAIKHLEQGLKLQPDDLETHIALATAYSKLGRTEEARKERMLCLQLTQNAPTQNGGTQVANP